MSEIKRGLRENLAYNLKLRRYLAGLTQSDVENLSGIPASSISQYENGTSDPLSTTLFALAKFYNTTVEALFLDWIEMRRRIYNFTED